MKSNIHHTPLRISSIPTIWTDAQGRTIHGYQNRTDLHYVDGWRDYVEPGFDQLTQRLGELIYDEAQDIVTRQVIYKTTEELEAERRAMVPNEIRPSQGKIMLHRMGLLDSVELMIQNSPDVELRLFWEYALTWELNNSYIQAMAASIGLTTEDVEAFFIQASEIR